MKTIYTILFFLCSIALTYFSYLLFNMIDHGIRTRDLILLLSGIILSIIALAAFIVRFIKIPASGKDK